jgi:hypothetical protein
MNTPKQPQKANDYAVAKELNKCVVDLLRIFNMYQLIGPHKDFDTQEINKVYVLLADELQNLYDQNLKLSEIKPDPIWRKIGYIQSAYNLQKYLEAFDLKLYSDHYIAKIDRLCIISGIEKPTYSVRQKQLVGSTKTTISKYYKLAASEFEKQPLSEEQNEWYIKEYTLTYKYGAIIVNGALKLKKAHDGSTLDELMLQAFNNANKIFTFTPKVETKRTVSTILSNAGFTPTLRELFFPEVGKSRGVLFRPNINKEVAIAERIDTTDIDQTLKDAGAEVVSTEPDDDEFEYVETI